MSAITKTEMPKQSVSRRRANEMFLAGLLPGAIDGIYFVSLVQLNRFLGSTSNLDTISSGPFLNSINLQLLGSIPLASRRL
jgi:hypothetical protein